MIERIADRPTLTAIDPIFVAPPSGERELFDAALSRAANAPRSDAPLHHAGERDGSSESTRRFDPTRGSERTPRDRDVSDEATEDAHAAERGEVPPGDDAATSGDAEGEEGRPVVVDRTTKSDDPTGSAESADETDASLVVIDAIAPTATHDEDAGEAEDAATNGLAGLEDGHDANANDGLLEAEHRVQGRAADQEGEATSPPLLDGATFADAALAQDAVQDAESPPSRPSDQASISIVEAAAASVTARSRSEQRAAVDANTANTATGASDAALSEQNAANVSTPADAAVATTPRLKAGNGTRESKPTGRALTSRSDPATAAANAPAAEAAASGPPTADAPSAAPSDDAANVETSTPQSAAAGPVVASAGQRENSAVTDVAHPRGLMSRLGHGRGSQAIRPGDGSNAEAEVQRVRLVQRVARAFQTLGDSGGEVRLRLSPPSLGSIRLEVTLQAGVMSARIETETASAKALIVDNLPALRERLATHDIKVAQFDVELAADSHRQGQFTRDDSPPERTPHGASRSSAVPRGEPQPMPARTQRAQGELDVVI